MQVLFSGLVVGRLYDAEARKARLVMDLIMLQTDFRDSSYRLWGYSDSSGGDIDCYC